MAIRIARGALLVLLPTFASLAFAQGTPKVPTKAAKPAARKPAASTTRLLSADEGLAVIGAALQTRHSPDPKGDCSHLVHSIYEEAGFPYKYAPSSELYVGVGEFRQVARPQPGDLAVWRGHAAIVINPAQHSFFSSTRTGLRVESYDTGYWKRRGPPRFLRYVKSPAAPATVVAGKKAPELQNVDTHVPVTVVAESDDPEFDEEPAPQAPASPVDLPRTVMVQTAQPQAKPLTEAIQRTFSNTDKALADQNVLKLNQAITIFERVSVKSVHIKGNQGSAEVKLEGISTLSNGRLTPKKKSETQRWALTRRDADAWELLLPPKNIYLARDVAVRILARQLSSLADQTSTAPDSSKDQALLARTLTLLLAK